MSSRMKSLAEIKRTQLFVRMEVEDVAMTSTLLHRGVDDCGHRYTLTWWMTRREPVHCVVDDVGGTNTLCGG